MKKVRIKKIRLSLCKLFLVIFLCLACQNVSIALLEFYVFKDANSAGNHFLNIEKNGDYKQIKYEVEEYSQREGNGSCLKLTYDPAAGGMHNWSSISWVVSDDEDKQRYNLAGAQRLVFYAKGQKGGEVVSFDVGSISIDEDSSAGASTGALVLDDEWREYSIDLEGISMVKAKVGFSVTVNAFDNSNGAVIYLDDIKYEFWNL